MSAPNAINAVVITCKTAVQLVGTSPAAIITNSGGSGKVIKVCALYVANTDVTTAYDATIEIYRAAVAYHIAVAISIPAKSSLDVLSKPIYLEEGDTLRLTASSASKLEAVASYEELS